MKLQHGVQEGLVTLLLYDENPMVIAGLLPANVYDSYYRDIVKDAAAYVERYGEAPGEHALDIFDALKARRPDDASVYDKIFASIEATREGINREFILAEATVFARHSRLRSGMSEAIDHLDRDDKQGVEAAEAVMTQCLASSYELFDPGGFFHDASRTLRFLDSDATETFPTGIDVLDRFGLGPSRKRLHILGGDTGFGKSWWLLHLAKHCLLARLRVLYITLELSEIETSQRLCQSFFAMTKRQEEITRLGFDHDEDGSFAGFEDVLLDDRPSFADKRIREELSKRLGKFKQRTPLLIKEFPNGQLTMPMLKSYLASLEGSIGFIPDILLLDYPEEMDIDPRNKRLELIKVAQDLKGLATERNMAVATVAQLSSEGGKARTATKHHLAEAKGIAARADVLLVCSQTMMEHRLGLARMFVAKGRSDRDKFTVLLSQNYATGQFVADSMYMPKTYWDHVEDLIGYDEDDEEEYDDE